MIKSNYDTEKYFVLSNEDDKIMSIIKCEEGESDITKRVVQSISEDEDLTSAIITDDVFMNENGAIYTFEVLTIDSIKESEVKTYFLTNVAIY